MFRRGPDECFGTLDALHDFCRRGRDESRDIWQKPDEIKLSDKMSLLIGEQPSRLLNDWSFSQVCRMAGVSKDTINRLSPRTASLALDETLPRLSSRCNCSRRIISCDQCMAWLTPGCGMPSCSMRCVTWRRISLRRKSAATGARACIAVSKTCSRS